MESIFSYIILSSEKRHLSEIYINTIYMKTITRLKLCYQKKIKKDTLINHSSHYR